MSTIEVVRGATRPRGSAVLLESWQAQELAAPAGWCVEGGDGGAPGAAFWLRSLREVGGVPQPPRVARSPLVGVFDA